MPFTVNARWISAMVVSYREQWYVPFESKTSGMTVTVRMAAVVVYSANKHGEQFVLLLK